MGASSSSTQLQRCGADGASKYKDRASSQKDGAFTPKDGASRIGHAVAMVGHPFPSGHRHRASSQKDGAFTPKDGASRIGHPVAMVGHPLPSGHRQVLQPESVDSPSAETCMIKCVLLAQPMNKWAGNNEGLGGDWNGECHALQYGVPNKVV